MHEEPPEMQLIRESLEGVLNPATASAVLIDALGSQSSPPRTTDELLAFLRGPIDARIHEQLDKRTRTELVALIAERIASSAADRSSVRRAERYRADEDTQTVVLAAGHMDVVVAAATSNFSDKLRRALGGEVASTLLAKDSPSLSSALSRKPPSLVVIDASDFPTIEPPRLISSLDHYTDEDAIRALWGSDLPYGIAVAQAAEQQGVAITPFDRREGIAPLMDIIRARVFPL